MADGSLKEKLEQRMQETGKINAGDLAAFSRKGAEEETAKAPEGPVEVPRSKLADTDELMQAAHTGAGAALNEHAEDTHVDFLTRPPPGPTVTVTPADREAFLDALITGKRFQREFELFGGKTMLKLRARTQVESQAIIARLKWELDHGLLDTQLDYTVRLRSMLLAAQVEEFDGTAYEPMAEPLRRTEGADGVKEPGWIAQADKWHEMNEATASIAHKVLQEFEAKYWTMIESAGDQNFWNPAASTSE